MSATHVTMQPRSRRQLAVWLFALFLLLTAVLVFFELAEDIWLDGTMSWDTSLMLAVHSLSQPWLDTFFWLVTQTAGPLIVVPVMLAAVIFWRRGMKWLSVLIFASWIGSLLLNVVLKTIFARPRPDVFPPLVVEHSYSFPSGHTMSAIAFYGLLSLYLWERRRRGWAVLAGLWVPLVALSRVYLGAHYPSDVLASLAIGTIWLVIVWMVYKGWYVDHAAAQADARAGSGT